MSFYFDDFGLLTQRDGDAGDCCNETGVYYFGVWVQKYILGLRPEDKFPRATAQDFLKAALQLEVFPGVLTRHPIQFPDPFRPGWITSRDQVSPIVLALGCWLNTHEEFRPILTRIRDYHRDRKRTVPFLWQYPNADVAGPEQISYYNRAFNTGGVYAGDIQLYGSSVVRCLNGDPDNVGDDRIHSMSLIYANLFRPTWIGRAALENYKKNRKPNYGTTKLGEKNNVQGAWSWYYRPESGNIWEIANEVWRPIIGRYF